MVSQQIFVKIPAPPPPVAQKPHIIPLQAVPAADCSVDLVSMAVLAMPTCHPYPADSETQCHAGTAGQGLDKGPQAASEPEEVPVAVYAPAQQDSGSNAASSQTAGFLIDTGSEATSAAPVPQPRPPPSTARHPGGMFFAQQAAAAAGSGNVRAGQPSQIC